MVVAQADHLHVPSLDHRNISAFQRRTAQSQDVYLANMLKAGSAAATVTECRLELSYFICGICTFLTSQWVVVRISLESHAKILDRATCQVLILIGKMVAR